MIIWAPGVSASSIDFTLIELNSGFQYDFVDQRMRPRSEIWDLARFKLNTTIKFPAPSDSIFWAFVNESQFRDGEVIVNYALNSNSDATVSNNGKISFVMGAAGFVSLSINGTTVTVATNGTANATLASLLSAALADPYISTIIASGVILSGTLTFASLVKGVAANYLLGFSTTSFGGVATVVSQPTTGREGAIPGGGYLITIKNGVAQQGALPAGAQTALPILCVLQGREIGPSAQPIFNATVSTCISNLDGTAYHTAAGDVSGIISTTTDIDGRWALPILPTDSLTPESKYKIDIRSKEIGSKRYDNIYIPNSIICDFNRARVISKIKDMEIIQPPTPEPLLSVKTGFTRFSGHIIDAFGFPVPDLDITIGEDISFENKYTQLAGTLSSAAFQVSRIESMFKVKTESHNIFTVSKFPNQEVTSISITPDSELISVITGHGLELRPPQFSYARSTGVLTFARPFFGVVKAKKRSTGFFSVDLPSGSCYFIQLGSVILRRSIYIPAGLTALGMGQIITRS